MAFSFSSKVTDLNFATQKFDNETVAAISELQGKNISVIEAQNTHNITLQTFQKTMGEISQIKNDIAKQITRSNEEEMIQLVSQITGYETTLLEQLNTFNDAILTYFPTAKISYGNSCVGNKIAPKINTLDKKVLQMLDNSFAIREIRGDGNCFLSAFTTRFLENLVETKQIESFIDFISQQDNIQTPGLKEELIDTLLSLDPSQLDSILNNNHKVLPFINFFRQIAAIEMKKNKNDFEAFFLADIEQIYGGKIDGQSYENLINKYVVQMGVDFSHPMITALCRKFDFPVQIIDPKLGATDGVNVLDRTYANGTFCRKDNHYFVLYTHARAPQLPISVSSPLSRDPVRPTEIIVNCKVPSGHQLFIRGSHNGLSWEKGILLTSLGNDRWIYPLNAELKDMEYKFLLNDTIWQEGDNNKIYEGKIIGNKPNFILPSSTSSILDVPPAAAPTTKIIVKFDAGLGSTVFIRGEEPPKGPAGMSWKAGIPLRNEGSDIWIFETQSNFENFEYKILLNDKIWENCPNHQTDCGKQKEVVPKFN